MKCHESPMLSWGCLPPQGFYHVRSWNDVAIAPPSMTFTANRVAHTLADADIGYAPPRWNVLRNLRRIENARRLPLCKRSRRGDDRVFEVSIDQPADTSVIAHWCRPSRGLGPHTSSRALEPDLPLAHEFASDIEPRHRALHVLFGGWLTFYRGHPRSGVGRGF
jgi:hypothetical protein